MGGEWIPRTMPQPSQVPVRETEAEREERQRALGVMLRKEGI
jgi:hypothetical protein